MDNNLIRVPIILSNVTQKSQVLLAKVTPNASTRSGSPDIEHSALLVGLKLHKRYVCLPTLDLKTELRLQKREAF